MPERPDSNLTLFQGVTVTPEGDLIPLPGLSVTENDSRQAYEQDMLRTQARLSILLPVAAIDLTPAEQRRVQAHQEARLLLDAAGAAPMKCSEACTFVSACPLFQIRKHPVGQMCPFEANFLSERFLEWLREFERTPSTLLASERMAIGNLCSLQLELQRVRSVMARPDQAEMREQSVKDVDQDGNAIAWENTISIAAQREDQILLNIRGIMKDFELTPEQKTKKAKALGIRPGNDVASKQAGLFERIRNRNAITVVPEPVTTV